MFDDPANRSCPLYRSLDEVKKEFLSRAQGAHSGLYGYCHADRLVGVLCYFALPKDNYLQTVAFLAAEDHASVFAAFLAHLRENFTGYEALIGITAENTQAAGALLASCYALAEASTDMRLNRSGFAFGGQPGCTIERIGKARFHEYAHFHDKHFQNIYWNSGRLYDKADAWYIFAVREGEQIVGGLFLTAGPGMAEIFGMAAESLPESCGSTGFLSAALNAVFCDREDVHEVVFLVDLKDEMLRAAAVKAGFEVIGHYRCYAAKIGE